MNAMKKLAVAIACGLLLAFAGLAHAVEMPALQVTGDLKVGFYYETQSGYTLPLLLEPDTDGPVGAEFTVTVTYENVTANAVIKGDVDAFAFDKGDVTIDMAPLTCLMYTSGKNTKVGDALELFVTGDYDNVAGAQLTYAAETMGLTWALAMNPDLTDTEDVDVVSDGAGFPPLFIATWGKDASRVTNFRTKLAFAMMEGFTFDAIAAFNRDATTYDTGYGLDAIYSMGMFTFTGAFASNFDQTTLYGVKAAVKPTEILEVSALYKSETPLVGVATTTLEGKVGATTDTASGSVTYTSETTAGTAVTSLTVEGTLTPMPEASLYGKYRTMSEPDPEAGGYFYLEGSVTMAPWTFKAAGQFNDAIFIAYDDNWTEMYIGGAVLPAIWRPESAYYLKVANALATNTTLAFEYYSNALKYSADDKEFPLFGKGYSKLETSLTVSF